MRKKSEKQYKKEDEKPKACSKKIKTYALW